MNLLKETLQMMGYNKMTIEDVSAIKTNEGRCGWKTFQGWADVEYENFHGTPTVCEDLVIVFKNGSWMERGRWMEREFWTFRPSPNANNICGVATTIFNK